MSGPAPSPSRTRPVRSARHPRRPAWLIVCILSLSTIVAAGVQLIPCPLARVVLRGALLADYFPPSMCGWKGADKPLADTEALMKQVGKILNFDEAFHRSYSKGGMEFSVYVAYWAPGKMPPREIAFHIPDKCWPTAGWKRTAAVYDYVLSVGDTSLAPAQYREFVLHNVTQNVLYWHIFNGRVIIYNRDGSPSDLSMLTDLLHLGFRLKGEQYFIRINSATSLETLRQDEGFQQILELLAPLGPGLDFAPAPH